MRLPPLVIAAALLCARTVTAQNLPESERLVRVALLRQAREELNAGRTAQALSLVQRAETIGATAGTRLLTAEIRARLAQHSATLASAEQCLADVAHDTQTTPQNLEAIRQRCTALRDEASAHVGFLRVEVAPGAPENLVVRVGDAVLPRAEYGTARPRDAGTVTVRATADGAPAWERQATVEARREAVVRVELARRETATTTPPVTTGRTSPLRYVGFGAIGVGAAAVVVGIVQAIRTSVQQSDTAGANANSTGELRDWYYYSTALRRQGTPSDTCNAAQSDTTDPSAAGVRRLCETNDETQAMALGFGIGGGALAAVGIVLVLVSPSARRTAWHVAPILAEHTQGAVMGFSF